MIGRRVERWKDPLLALLAASGAWDRTGGGVWAVDIPGLF